MTQRRGLGRGLGALIPTAPSPPLDAATDPGESRLIDLTDAPSAAERDTTERSDLRFAELPLDAVAPNPRQPRQVFDEEQLAELVNSIREIGLLQPIVVRPSATGYELVAGERRLRACRLAGLDRVPALVRGTADDAMLRDALLENLHRVQLNPLEEAAAYSQLMADFACTQDELAQRVGRSRPQIANTLRLLKLPAGVQRRVAAGVISAGHARAILGAPDADAMERLAARVVAEGLSVRAVEELVLVDEGQRRPRRRGARETPLEYQAAADRLSDRLETRVRIESGRTKGRLIVEFAAVDDLARIVALVEGSTGDPQDGYG